ncbi:hypothetical protein LCGC14_1783520 [marine sediment metagenome]|uniref:Uncharacterized protein n=1 Tax=marine sediment metagenome TaxID=412755 RepID=A0A0F9GUT3_9ZZZZ
MIKISINIEVIMKDGVLILTDTEGKAVTFSKDQLVQKKVSMVTLGELADLPRIKVAQAFGFATRKSYYDARYAVLNGVATDLFPQRTGPKEATKRTRELEVKVIQMRFDTTYNMYEIADELKRLGFDISARLVGKILSDFGLSKKKLR